ncbi:protoheme IX farnesyltransferase [Nesterenkonia sp. MY13]|uniref:Protoheme IX farnesyltransferase n=1 Tax=Nesterenkonia sedimenti TaxID=1463632 RepID=A0A7X8TH97_9MICC|nr:protoheme IX farnesyltransferase [Nesterenkonia sedimenti]
MVTDLSTRTSPDSAATEARRISFKRKMAAYVSLTKPRVMELLIVTAFPTMFFAQGGLPNVWVALATVIGGAAAAGSASAFNCYIDRDMDKLMNRTKKRPLVTGELSPREALIFAWALGVVSMLVLWFGTNPLATALGAAAIFFYVVVYTLILKRRTEQNIIWGGIAGCFPVLIAWAAVREAVEWPALVLFFIIFLWTPPHYWPLSMKYRTDYQAADVPMLGAVATAKTVSVQVVLYAWATVVCSLLLIPLGWAGITYTAFAVVAGAWFVYESHVLYRRAQNETLTDKRAMKVFHLSILYLTLLFIGLWIDPFIGSPLMS